MRAYDAAMIAFGLAVLSAPAFGLLLVKKAWRRWAWRGLQGSLALLVIGLTVGVATSPPKEVLEAEARERADRSEQAARERAAKLAADDEASRLAHTAKVKEQEIARERAEQQKREAERQREAAAAIERERQARETAAQQAAESAAREARHKQLEAEAIEATRAARASAEAVAEVQGSYTDAQIKLAGQIGSVMGLVERCGTATLPSAAILRAMKAEGLREGDMTRDTAFKARVVKQVQTMKVMDGVAANAGRSERERRKDACSQLTEMYGPEGFVRPGLAAPR